VATLVAGKIQANDLYAGRGSGQFGRSTATGNITLLDDQRRYMKTLLAQAEQRFRHRWQVLPDLSMARWSYLGKVAILIPSNTHKNGVVGGTSVEFLIFCYQQNICYYDV